MLGYLPLVLSLLGAAHGMPQRNPVFTGVVSKVLDGDTIQVRLEDKSEMIINLWGIDAPETDQPFGAEATEHLSKLALKRTVVVEYYGAVSDVYVNLPKGQVNANRRMVEEGYAWYQRVPEDSLFGTGLSSLVRRLREAEEAARKSKVGLWKKPGAIAPWEWVKRKKPGQ